MSAATPTGTAAGTAAGASAGPADGVPPPASGHVEIDLHGQAATIEIERVGFTWIASA